MTMRPTLSFDGPHPAKVGSGYTLDAVIDFGGLKYAVTRYMSDGEAEMYTRFLSYRDATQSVMAAQVAESWGRSLYMDYLKAQPEAP